MAEGPAQAAADVRRVDALPEGGGGAERDDACDGGDRCGDCGVATGII